MSDDNWSHPLLEQHLPGRQGVGERYVSLPEVGGRRWCKIFGREKRKITSKVDFMYFQYFYVYQKLSKNIGFDMLFSSLH